MNMKKIAKNKTDVLSNGDIEKIGSLLDNAFDSRLSPLEKKVDDMTQVMVTKDDLKNTKLELKDYINEGVQSVMDGMDKLSEQLAEKQRVDRLELWTKQIAQKVGVKLV